MVWERTRSCTLALSLLLLLSYLLHVYKSGYRGSDGPLAVEEVIPLPVITDAFLKGMVSMGHPTRDCNGEEMIGKLISLEDLHMVHVSVKWKRRWFWERFLVKLDLTALWAM